MHTLSHSTSATHLSGLSNGSGGSSSTATQLPRPSRQSTVSTMLGSSDKKPRGSKDSSAVDKAAASSTSGVDEKRKRSAFLGGLQFVKRKAAGGSSNGRTKEEGAQRHPRLVAAAFWASELTDSPF
jgi:hypothetical protein